MNTNRFSRRSAKRPVGAMRGFETLEPRSMMAADSHAALLPPVASAGHSDSVGAMVAQIKAVPPAAPSVTTPGMPTDLTALAADGKAYLSWKAPGMKGGAEKIFYAVKYSSDGGTTWTTVERKSYETRTMVGNLTNGTSYIFQVAAMNKVGSSAFTESSAAITPTKPTKPAIPQR